MRRTGVIGLSVVGAIAITMAMAWPSAVPDGVLRDVTGEQYSVDCDGDSDLTACDIPSSYGTYELTTSETACCVVPPNEDIYCGVSGSPNPFLNITWMRVSFPCTLLGISCDEASLFAIEDCVCDSGANPFACNTATVNVYACTGTGACGDEMKGCGEALVWTIPCEGANLYANVDTACNQNI